MENEMEIFDIRPDKFEIEESNDTPNSAMAEITTGDNTVRVGKLLTADDGSKWQIVEVKNREGFEAILGDTRVRYEKVSSE